MSDFSYLEVKIEKDLSPVERESLISLAGSEYGCNAVHESSLSEEEIDNLIGSEAYCGGNLPQNLQDALEKFCSDQLNFIFEIENSTRFEEFLNYLDKSKITYSTQKLKSEDWNKEWRKQFSRIEVSKQLSLIPSWEKQENKKDEIYVYPGMGFGTGNHSTTFLCLSVIEKFRNSGFFPKKVLDFGCGSGILGITVDKLFGTHSDYCDIDDQALDNCRQNLELNELSYSDEQIFLREKYKPSKKYDLVFANILQHVLEEEKSVIVESLEDNGYLVLSGILKDQIDSTLVTYKELKIEEILIKDDWAAILLQKI